MNDTEHTRIIQSKEYKDFEFNLKQLLVYYCDNNKIYWRDVMYMVIYSFKYILYFYF